MLPLSVVNGETKLGDRARRLSFLFLAQAFGYSHNLAIPSQIGTVIELRGNWIITGQADPLRLGGGVPAGAVVALQAAGSDASISIVLLNGKYLGMRCQASSLKACVQGLRIPATYIEGTSTVRKAVQTVMNVLWERPPEAASPFSPTIIRTGREYKRCELVAPIEEGKALPLDDAVFGMQAGNYTLEWSDVSGPKPSEQTPVRWDSRDARPLLPIRAAGLYSVRLVNEYREPILDIALLAVPLDRYNSINPEFERAKQMCAQWTGPGALDSQHEFLRAYLIALVGKK
jgi:hypothetical protein